MKKFIDLNTILVQFVICAFLLTFFAVMVPLTYQETHWNINWENVPEDIRSNYAKFRCMTVAENGDLWAGNDNGVVHISGQTWETFSSRILHHIRDIEIAPNGDVWVLTERNDVLRYSGNTWEQVEDIPAIQDITITPDGSVWSATPDGIAFFDGKTWQPTSYIFKGPNEHTGICAMDAAADGSLWAGGCTSEFFLLHIQQEQMKQSDPADGVGFITKIDANSPIRVWLYSLGTKSGINSLAFYENEKWHLFGPSYLSFAGIDIDYVYDLSADSNGNAWIATPSSVCRYNGQYCMRYLKGESIYSVAAAPDGSVWLGLENQIVKLSR